MMSIGTSWHSFNDKDSQSRTNFKEPTVVGPQNTDIDILIKPNDNDEIFLGASSINFDWKLILICSIAGVTLLILSITVIV